VTATLTTACSGRRFALPLMLSVGLTMDDAEVEKPDFAGMTVNERLFVAGLLNQFDDAARARDRARMIELLSQIEVVHPDRSVDTILDNPTKYGY
jgi:hypothetical protein